MGHSNCVAVPRGCQCFFGIAFVRNEDAKSAFI